MTFWQIKPPSLGINPKDGGSMWAHTRYLLKSKPPLEKEVAGEA